MKEKILISDNLYWNFNENPVFVGRPLRFVFNGVGDLIGIEFEEYKTNDVWNIPANFSIIKACQTVIGDGDDARTVIDEHMLMRIEYLGHTLIKGNRPFKRFRIYLLDEE